jgi:hypothetical protein
MSKQSGSRGREASRQICPECLRSIAVGYLTDGRTVRLRPHNNHLTGVRCKRSGAFIPRNDRETSQ